MLRQNDHDIIDLAKFPLIGIQGNPSTDNIEIRNFNAPLSDSGLVEEGFRDYRQDWSWYETPGLVYRQWGLVLHFVQLPGCMRGISLKEWKVDLDMTSGTTQPRPYAWNSYMDSHQDLLVLVPQPVNSPDRIRFQLRRMTDGAEHPLAAFPDMALIPSTGHLITDGSMYPATLTPGERPYHRIAMHGQYIVIEAVREWGSKLPSNVILLDWNSGKVVQKWLISFARAIGFLDAQTFICLIVESTDHPIIPRFEIYDIANRNEDSEGFFRPTPILTLNCSPNLFHLASSGVYFGKAPCALVVGTDPPFRSQPGRLILLSITKTWERTPVFLVTSTSHLLDLVSKERNRNQNLGFTETRTLNPESWPNCTFRLLGHTTPLVYKAYGMRALFSVHVPSDETTASFDHWMLDFATRSWRRDAQGQLGEDDTLPLKDFAAHNFPTPIARKVRSVWGYGRLHPVEDGIIGLNGSKYGHVVIINTAPAHSD
ncbi:hypothetical protein BDN72DRAFT_841934 [Pluteus cervinus]|uniref:Uncharacterized protein n=1 Tax=Pluteus cervinus TaxID=181527 RepID=A0ACD3ASN6_9AGAR|nr:hypothetical protein BDN72DRAFT_841934 [Pluteus cervinus]